MAQIAGKPPAGEWATQKNRRSGGEGRASGTAGALWAMKRSRMSRRDLHSWKARGFRRLWRAPHNPAVDRRRQRGGPALRRGVENSGRGVLNRRIDAGAGGPRPNAAGMVTVGTRGTDATVGPL
ncbi:hypothetical protein GCM10011358_16880 [Sinisalibacter lacisalsi]|uniref:Uncharacterized protein n=1 Tax=Sinisalibacter lacisalsi TaxID=1526570 RepID=A0ABQ1QND1_9RHOB|nr:hypothetical protein GCM10011358_16880 [Sinisalibacter lacisalsi]